MTCRWCGSKRARTEPILRWRNPMHVEAGRQCIDQRACERRRIRAKLDEEAAKWRGMLDRATKCRDAAAINLEWESDEMNAADRISAQGRVEEAMRALSVIEVIRGKVGK